MSTTADAQELVDLAAAVAELCADAGGVGPARAMEGSGNDLDATLWDQIGMDMGLACVGLPEEVGGLGGLAEIVTVAGALGAALAPVPFWSSTVLTGQMLAAIEPRPAGLLTRIAAGEVAAAVIADPEGRWDPARVGVQARSVDGSWRLDGTVHFVVGGTAAGLLVVAATVPDGVDLFAVEHTSDGVDVLLAPSLDLSRPLSSVHLTAALGERLTTGGAGADAVQAGVDVALIALAAEQAGAARRCLEMTLEYVKLRHQFSRPIGGFQVVKHRLVDLLAQVEFATSAVDRALTGGADRATLAEAAAVAAAWCGDAFRDVCGEMIQLHGGIGFTWEHDAHLYFRRAHSDAVLLGDPDFHRERLAALLSW